MSRTPRVERCANAADRSSTRSVMWKARAALVEVLRNRRIRRSRFQQFETRVAGMDEVRPHTLRGHLFGTIQLQAKCVMEEGQRRPEVGHGDADVIEIRFHTALRHEDTNLLL